MSSTFDRLKAALPDRYTIEHELGAGGMAIVYLATDPKLDRQVAIKVLRPELAAAMGIDRFVREVDLTSQLEHPNILSIFDAGEAEGFLYYVMPFVEGESLRDRLDRETQLPMEDALQIAKDVASALGHSHSKGIMHRDIKPDNILLEGGRAVVADFGIARAVTMAGGEKLTQTGMAIGTPSYMSPEQAAGMGNVDHRTDIYALGCVLYEMLAGEAPYTGPTAQAVIAKSFSAPIPSVRRVRNAVPEDIDAAIEKALDKTPADRFDSTERFIEALTGERPVRSSSRSSQRVGVNPWVVGAPAALAVGVALWFGVGPGGGADAAVDPIDLLVATPIVNGADSILGSVVKTALDRAILESPFVQVMPPNEMADVFASMGREPTDTFDQATALEIAERSGAAAVVVPTLSRSGTTYFLNARVLAPDGEQRALAAATAQDESDLIVALDSLQVSVRRELGETGESLQQSKSLTYVTTSSVAAFRMYVQAEALQYTALNQATELLREAVDLDSTFALAWVGLSSWGAEAGRDVLLPVEHLAMLMDRMDGPDRQRSEDIVRHLVERDLVADRDAWRRMLELQSSTDQDAEATFAAANPLYNPLTLALLDLGEFDQAEESFQQLLNGLEALPVPMKAGVWGNGAGAAGMRALLPAAVAYERSGMPDSAAAIYEEIVRMSPIGDMQEFAGFSLTYERYALRRILAMGGAGADDARRQLRHAWQDATPEFRRRVVEPVLGR